MPKNDPHRCAWAKGPLMEQYHDTEWGLATRDEQQLYEMLLLEAFQAGLSWYVVLSKRENFRAAFDQFDPHKIAAYGEDKILQLLGDPGIIRSRRKIEGAIRNAQCFLDIQQELGSFANYLYSFTDGQVIVNTDDAFLTHTELSDTMAKDMKKRGFKFMGTVTLYSYLQAVGLVNDHEVGCFCYSSSGAPAPETLVRAKP